MKLGFKFRNCGYTSHPFIQTVNNDSLLSVKDVREAEQLLLETVQKRRICEVNPSLINQHYASKSIMDLTHRIAKGTKSDPTVSLPSNNGIILVQHIIQTAIDVFEISENENTIPLHAQDNAAQHSIIVFFRKIFFESTSKDGDFLFVKTLQSLIKDANSSISIRYYH